MPIFGKKSVRQEQQGPPPGALPELKKARTGAGKELWEDTKDVFFTGLAGVCLVVGAPFDIALSRRPQAAANDMEQQYMEFRRELADDTHAWTGSLRDYMGARRAVRQARRAQ